MMHEENDNPIGDDSSSPPREDELDALLRQWHEVHAQRAREGRDQLLQALVGAEPASGDVGLPGAGIARGPFRIRR